MSIRPGVFKFVQVEYPVQPVIQRFIPSNIPEANVKLIEFIPNSSKNSDISKEKIIFCAGAGAGQKGFQLLEQLAGKTGGKVGATRAAVEKIPADKEIQIGQTGKNISAKVYVGAAVSGAVQHLAGIGTCEKIVAVNNDKSAPIFENADYGIVADMFDIIPDLLREF